MTYAKLSVEELEARFAHARAEPSMRSVTAILRITREQVGARGFLNQYPRAAIGAVFTSAVLLGIGLLLPAEYRTKLLGTAGGALIVAAVLGYGAITGAADRRTAAEQERELRRHAAESLDEILLAQFPRKKLEWEQIGTLKELVRAYPERTRLRELLESVK